MAGAGDQSIRIPTQTEPVISGRGLAKVLSRPWLAILIFSIAILKVVSVWMHLERSFSPQDFSVYYCEGLLLLHSENPYTADLPTLAKSLGLEKGYVAHANNPPSFIALCAPLPLMSPHHAYWTWQAINVAAFAACIFLLLAPRYSGLDAYTALSLAAFAILFPPVGNNFALAQSKILLLLLLVAMLRCMHRGRDGAAGILLAAAGLLWVFPLLLGGYVILRRRWRMLAYLIAGLAIGGIATLAIMGIATSLSFFNSLDYLTSRTWISSDSNLSLESIISRIVWYLSANASGDGVEIVRRVCVRGADLVVLYFVIRATPLDAREDRTWRALSLWIAVSMMLSPTAWFHYLLLMLFPFAQMAGAAAQQAVRMRALWMAAASYLLAGIIGSTQKAIGVNPHLFHMLRGTEVLCLLTAVMAVYWFASDNIESSKLARPTNRESSDVA